MTQQEAVETLETQGVPYSITNRAGDPGGVCTVTDQRDKGYRTEVESTYDWEDGTWDDEEVQVWLGIGLTVVCR